MVEGSLLNTGLLPPADVRRNRESLIDTLGAVGGRPRGAGMSSIRPLNVALTISGGVGAVVVAGELDLYSVPRLKQAVGEALRAQVGRVVLDLGGVSFIDVRGFELLVEVARETRDRGAGFALRHPSEAVVRLAELVRLDETVLPIES